MQIEAVRRLQTAEVPGQVRVSRDGLTVSFDPFATLGLNVPCIVEVTPQLLDCEGTPAVPFTSRFDTTSPSVVGASVTNRSGAVQSTVDTLSVTALSSAVTSASIQVWYVYPGVGIVS